jgi:hypothetical protein
VTLTAALTHIAIQEPRNGKVVAWIEEVSDEEYREAGSKKKEGEQPSRQ